MTAHRLLDELYARGIAVWAEDTHLRLIAAEEDLPPSLLAAIKTAKKGLVSLLQSLGATTETWPLRHNQRALWRHRRNEPESPVYHVIQVFELDGAYREDAWEAAVRDLLLRHPLLRARFFERRGAVYQSWPDASPGPCRHHRASLWDDQAIQAWLDTRADAPFPEDLSPPLRLDLLHHRRADGREETLVALTVHHIAADFHAAQLIRSDLETLYRDHCSGRGNRLPPAADHYQAILQAETRYLGQPDFAVDREYWRRKLDAAPHPGNPLTTEAAGFLPRVRSRRIRQTLSAGLSSLLRGTARSCAATPFILTLAGLQAGLFRLSGETDWLIGTPSSNRDRPGDEAVVGDFVQLLPLVLCVSQRDSLQTLVARTRAELKGALAHRRFPLMASDEKSLLPGVRLPSIYLAWNRQPTPIRNSENRVRRLLRAEQRSVAFPLVLTVFDAGGDFELHWSFDANRVDETMVEALATMFPRLMAFLCDDPDRSLGRFELLSETRHAALAVILHGPRRPVRETGSLYPRFHDRVLSHPDRVAFAQDEASAPEMVTRHIGYRALAERAGRVAQRLHALGVLPEEPVAYRLPNSPARLAAMLGILAAGGACLPIAEQEPPQRMGALLTASGSRLFIGGLSRPPSGWPPPGCNMRYLSAERLFHDPAPFPSSPRQPFDRQTAFLFFTSGSSGTPKAVAVPHAAIVDLIEANRFVPIGAEDVVAHVANPAFDAASFEIWGALLNRARLQGFQGKWYQDPRHLRFLLASRYITLCFTATALLHRAASIMPGLFPPRLKLLFGGEKLRPAALIRILAGNPPNRTIHVYGPTEATTFATWHQVAAPVPSGTPSKTVPIGKPLANRSALLLGPDLAPLPPGALGELFLGGSGLARGYLSDPAQTAARFIPNPFAETPGDRLYCSGDRAMLDKKGRLLFAGRLDSQIKLRGFRIEPGEIQAALAAHPQIAECAVVPDRSTDREMRLAAYWTPSQALEHGNPVADPELREFLAARLPAHMIPAVFVRLDRLPLNANGKLDRRALPKPQQGDGGAGNGPQSPAEQWLAGRFEALLGIARADRDTNFFACGGHSLSATQLAAEIRGRFDGDFPLRTLYETPRLADLARCLEPRPKKREAAAAPFPEIDRGPTRFTLSPEQQRLWLQCRLEGGSRTYHMPLALNLRGPLCPASLARAWRRLLAVQPALSSVVYEDKGVLDQEILPDRSSSLPLLDLSGLPFALASSLAEDLAGHETQLPFAMTGQRFHRNWLCRLNQRNHLLFIHLHHIVADERSLEILGETLSRRYHEFLTCVEPAPEPRAPYRALIAERRAYEDTPEARGDFDYWRARLAGFGGDLELPVDLARPPFQRHRGATRSTVLSPSLSAALRTLFREMEITPFVGLLGIFKVLLWRYSGQADLAIGVPVALRRQAGRNTMGFFVNTALVRGRVRGRTSARALWLHLRDAVAETMTHGRLPFQRIVEAADIPREPGRHPLFQAFFVLHGSPWEAFDFPGVQSERLALTQAVSKFDLTLLVRETPATFDVSFEYDRDLFTDVTATRWCRHFERLAAAMAGGADLALESLSPLGRQERFQLLHAFNATRPADPMALSLPEAVYRIAQVSGDRGAVFFRDGSSGATVLTYGYLARWSAHIARALHQVRPGRTLAVFGPRHPRLIAAWLAGLWRGAAVLILDDQHPRARLNAMVEDVLPAAVLRDPGIPPDLLPGSSPIPAPSSREMPEIPPPFPVGKHVAWPAYLIFSSGSTGPPKASVQGHSGLANLAAFQRRAFELDARARVLQFANPAFDAFVWELVMALGQGGALVMGSAERLVPGPGLTRFLNGEMPTHATLPPSTLRLMHPAQTLRPQCLIVAGEACPPHLARSWRGQRSFFNAYGPSEATVCATTARVTSEDDRVAIGRPIDGCRVYVLDSFGRPQPTGVLGELGLGGACVGSGYWRRLGTTARRFVPDAYGGTPGGRLFLTGDRARLVNGQLHFEGRYDRQIKLRGIRVELEEVEAVLARHPGVAEAAVVARDLQDPLRAGLHAFWSPVPAARPAEAGELRAWLAERLPVFAIPNGFTMLDRLPRNLANKVDYARLPMPSPAAPVSQPRPPRDAMEALVAGVWEEVLGLAEIDIEANFFESGGNSLSAVAIQSRLQARLGRPLTMVGLFQFPTIASYAAFLGRESDGLPLSRARGRAARRRARIPRRERVEEPL